jgi:hypothetical protein
MLEGDRRYLSKYAIDPELDSDIDGYEVPDFEFGSDMDPDLDHIDIDEPDEDLWGDY